MEGGRHRRAPAGSARSGRRAIRSPRAERAGAARDRDGSPPRGGGGAASELKQLSVDEILEAPYALIGTVDEMVESLHARRERWGLSYFVTFEPYLETLAPVVARLSGR